MLKHRRIGDTKTQGWEIGVRRTFPISTERAWDLLMTPPGLEIWLGKGIDPDTLKTGGTFTTINNTTGEIRSYTEGSLIRMRWQPRELDFASTLQIRVMPAKRGATISIHHEKLESGDQREAMRLQWSAALDRLQKLITEEL